MTAQPLVTAAPYLIAQRYEDYKAEEHAVWSELVRRSRPQLERCACREYLEGYDIIGLQEERLPNLQAITDRLKPRTGWSPTTTRPRGRDSLEYTPEPDIFHDVFGHVPMHTHRVFADFLQHYGSVCAKIADRNTLERLGRLFWYTVEFGLIRQDGTIKVYGSGVISSHGECTNIIEGGCEIKDFALAEVLMTPVKVDQMHKLLFAIESFDQVYEAMREAEKLVGPGS
jgi:phenylalanine-4-hydroxylase